MKLLRWVLKTSILALLIDVKNTVDGQWREWNTWYSCTRTCGAGTRGRTRQCGGSNCWGSSYETEPCNTDPCPVDGQWGAWSYASGCTLPCGNGTVTRTRRCDLPAPRYGGRTCSGESQEKYPCNTQPCPVDGKWGNWGEWTDCTKECGGGMQSRTRQCDPPRYGGKNCIGNAYMTKECNSHSCPVDGNWGQWNDWSQCTKTCGNGTTTRTRTCDSPAPVFGGKVCDGDAQNESTCNAEPCPVDGLWTQWSAWLQCTETCGGGIRNRLRQCDSPPPSYGGSNCSGNAEETESCNSHSCPVEVDGQWGQWSNWLDCTRSCGGGTRTRTRQCDSPPPSSEDKYCSGYSEEGESCNSQPCPVDGLWGQWSHWSQCNQTCDGGMKIRTRQCDSPPPSDGGNDCIGDPEETASCNSQPCPEMLENVVAVDGQWGQWSNWSVCTLSCGGGTKTRQRLCDSPPPSSGGKTCMGGPVEGESCSQPCPVDGQWGRWSYWSACTRTCDGGTRKRTRECNSPSPNYGGRNCSGYSSQTDYYCSSQSCPVNGQWGQWSYWSQCTRSCGGGTRTGRRQCNAPPPMYGGRSCVGSSQTTQPCTSQPCPVNGQWGQWSYWSQCTRSCGGGTRTRRRQCNAPSPRYGGRPCAGDSQATNYCTSQPCPVNGIWSPWTNWSACDKSCGSGSRIRRRQCSPPRYGGMNCYGPYTDYRYCYYRPCPSHRPCPSEFMVDKTFGNFSWPSVYSGENTHAPCPRSMSNGTTANATRLCKSKTMWFGYTMWGTPNFSQCRAVNSISVAFQNLANTPINKDNVEELSNNISSLSDNLRNYTQHELAWTMDVVEGILNTTASETLPDVISNSLKTVNNFLFSKETSLEAGERAYNTSSRMVQFVNSFFEAIDVNTSDYEEVRENIAGVVSEINPNYFRGISLSVDMVNKTFLSAGKVVKDTSGDPVLTNQSGIQITGAVIASLPAAERNNLSKGILSVYREPKIFSVIQSKHDGALTDSKDILDNSGKKIGTREVNSHVIGASFPGVLVEDLKDTIILTFQHFKRAVNPECVYWVQSSHVTGNWSSEGCSVNRSEASFTVCQCNHLTNFALLMDVYGQGERLHTVSLAVITYIGCGISFVAMLLATILFIRVKNLRKDNRLKKIMINLCVAIGLVDLVFITGMQDYSSKSQVGCKIVAIFLHFLLLANWCWMAVQGFYLYLTLVKVFRKTIRRFSLKICLFGWGIPLLVSVLTLSINTDNYGLQPGEICWLSQTTFYVAFLAPVALVMVVNSIVFVLVLKQIINRSSNKLTKSQTSRLWVRVRGAIGLTVLLGLTWAFALLAIGDFGIVFHYLFSIFNSLQGLFIFYFFCLRSINIRNLWRQNCLCFKPKYTSDTSTQPRGTGDTNTSDSKVGAVNSVQGSTKETVLSGSTRCSLSFKIDLCSNDDAFLPYSFGYKIGDYPSYFTANSLEGGIIVDKRTKSRDSLVSNNFLIFLMA